MEFLILWALFHFISLVCAIPAIVNTGRTSPTSPALVERDGPVDDYACSVWKLPGLCAKDKDSCNAVSFFGGCAGIESCCVQQVKCAYYTDSNCLNTDKVRCDGGKWIDNLCPGLPSDNIKCCVTTAAAAPAGGPNRFTTVANPLDTPDSSKVDMSTMASNKDLKNPALEPNSVGTLDLANPFLEEIPGSGPNSFVAPNSAAVPNYYSAPLAEGITDPNPQLPTWQDFFQDDDDAEKSRLVGGGGGSLIPDEKQAPEV